MNTNNNKLNIQKLWQIFSEVENLRESDKCNLTKHFISDLSMKRLNCQ